jgi:hypothetical protein
MRQVQIASVTFLLLSAVACDYTGDWLFAGAVEDAPGVVHLGDVAPVEVTNINDIRAATIYGEVGPTGSVAMGGVTFTFVGNGGDVCVWVDPELAFWSQSVSPLSPNEKWNYPDNVFDDGDIDLFAGFAVYYTGSPGETIGDFRIQYEDSLGNKVPVELNECTIAGSRESSGGHSGRGAPEFCTMSNTVPDVSYMVLMETFSTPLDDDRMGYGLLLANGNCDDVLGLSGMAQECVITGEAIDPETGDTWDGSVLFEETFCDAAATMPAFCENEAATRDCTDPDQRCYCGDPTDVPTGGGLTPY